jgi:hypothetical protein
MSISSHEPAKTPASSGAVDGAAAQIAADPAGKAGEPETRKVAAAETSASENESVAQAKSDASSQTKPIDAMTPEELLAALNEFPPELREQALRQFVAVIAQSAGQTDHPNTLHTELAKKMNDLPTLPEPTSTPSATPPARLAASQLDAGRSEGNPGYTASLTDNDSSELESVEAQTVSETASADSAAIKTASAAREANEGLMVSQAVGKEAAVDEEAETGNSETARESKPPTEQELLAQLIKQWSTGSPDESEAERNSRLIKLRHLMVMAGDPDSAVQAVDEMADAEQEYLRHQLLGLWTMIDPQGHPVPSRRFSSAIPQIREAAKFAAAATDSLEVRSLAFCTEIESYGQIKPFSGNRFDAGQQVILYCEIENFTAKRLEDGYETHLQGNYDVYNSENQKVFSQVLPADKQVSANYLRDYFIAYQMFLPSELEPGTYRLQLTMEDAHGKKYGQSSIPFEIAK